MKSHATNQIMKYRAIKICTIALIITGVSLPNLAQQKTFFINNKANPLKNFSVPSNKESHPFFIDIDGDGDLDCFSGEYTNGTPSKIYYYRNDGSNKSPVFKQLNGNNNPLNKVVANTLSIPYFIDIDNNGSFDCFISDGYTGSIMYYKNTGSATHPEFEKQSAALNPLSMVKFSCAGVANTAFADVDGDGDYDCLIVDEQGAGNYFKNFGTAKEPVFVHVTGSNDPFTSLTTGKRIYNVSLEDFNQDGMIDLFINTTYHKNIGTKTKPIFALFRDDEPIFQYKPGNQYSYTPLRWVDLNNDGDVEVFQGSRDGSFVYQTVNSNKHDETFSSLNSSIHVFPNPSKEEFVLENIPSTGTGETVIYITDLQGKLLAVKTANVGFTKFGKELKTGVYFIQVIQNTKLIYNQKIIKE
jgi:hypothetical protein